jgi:protein-S-isoprenylcysteine O-methyltransferase Ste14
MKSPLNRGGLRFYLVFIALVWGILLFDSMSTGSIVAGLPFLIVGAWIHTWAKGCLRQNRAVATSGPYRFVRHPFYLANALIDLSLVLMAGAWPLVIALPFWWLAIYIPVIGGEERYLIETFPAEYPTYKRQVPCLIPWRRPLQYTGEGFRWANPNIAGGEELPRLLRILAYPLLFFVAMQLKYSGFAWLSDGWGLTAFAGLLMFYALAAELHGHQRQRRWIFPAAMRHPLMRVGAAAAVLAAVCLVSGPHAGFRDVMPAGGAALLMLSVPVFIPRPLRAFVAESLALLGVIAAGQLLWLAPLMIVIYSGWMLDWQLSNQYCADVANDTASRPAFWPYFYVALVVAGAAVVGIKLVGHGLPFHVTI